MKMCQLAPVILEQIDKEQRGLKYHRQVVTVPSMEHFMKKKLSSVFENICLGV